MLTCSLAKSENLVHINTQEETIVYAMPYDFGEYSVYTVSSYATAQWVSAVYAGLLKRSSANNRDWVPDLAQTMPNITNNGLTFTYQLRNDLYFSNGKPLTTDDVKFSLNTALTPEVDQSGYNAYSQYLTNDSFHVISDTSFSITLTQFNPFPYGLLSFAIVPQETYGKQYQSCLDGVVADCSFNNLDGSSAISAGPFKIYEIKNDTNANLMVSLVANPHYYDADKVKTDKIIFEKIADKSTAISALSDGSIDIMDSQYVPGLNELEGISGITQHIVADPATQEMALNHKHPYFGTGELIPNSIGDTNQSQIYENARLLRRAMSMIMNRVSFVDRIFEGLALPIATTFSPASIGFDPTITPDPYNVSAAIAIMKSLGFNYTQLGTPNANGVYPKSFFNITSLAPTTGPARNQWADAYPQELPIIGIGVTKNVLTGWAEIVPRTFGSHVEPPLYDNGGFDIFFVGNAWSLDWNPGGMFSSSGKCSFNGQTNRYGYYICDNFYNFDLNETMTPIAQAVRQYLNSLDYDTRLQSAHNLQELLYYWLPTIPILNPTIHWAWSDKITGIDASLISTSNQEWELVYKTGFQTNPKLTGPGSVKTESRRVSFPSFIFLGFPVLVLLKKLKMRNLVNFDPKLI